MNGSQVLEPKLFCRTTSSLVWHWETIKLPQESPVIYVVSLRDSQDSWVWHDVVSEAKFIIDELPSDTGYQLKVLYVGEEGSLVGPCSSEWVSTLNASFIPPPVNLTVAKEYQFSENYVNMSIIWEPNIEDKACDYKLLYWNVHGHKLEEINYQMEFSALLPNLDFNNSYRAYVFSGDSEKDIWGIEKAEVAITTPSCLDVWNNNISICNPPPPIMMQINFLSVDSGHFDMNISWIPGRISPERYAVSMSEVEPPIHRSELKFVDGNETSTIFKNTKPATLYLGCVIAVSSAGNSTPICNYRKFRAPLTKKWEHSEIAIVIAVSLAVPCVIMLFTVYLYYRHNRKKKETLQRSQFFENLEKEPPKEKDYESTDLYFDDEWEISEDCLTIEEEVGGGAFGVVHRGLLRGKIALGPPQYVAVKMMKDYSNLEDLRQFQQEISIMKSVRRHPHIVSIIGCCTCSKQAKLVVEYCALGNLHDYLEKCRTLDDDEVQTAYQFQDRPIECVKYAELLSSEKSADAAEYELQIKTNVAVNEMYFGNCEEKKPKKQGLQPVDLLSFARQIAIGMEYLAGNRVVHRDLAARNVLVCANKTVKISDFGLSKDIYEQNVYHQKGNGKLPVRWMAIESLMYRIYTTQSDVWSFGVLLWEIFTFGAVPYPSTPVGEVLDLLGTGHRMECPRNCSQELYNIMLSCWKEIPKDRPSFTDLRNSLDSLLETTSPQQYLNLNITNIKQFEISAEDQPMS